MNGCILCLRNYETSCHLLLVCVVSFVTLLSRFCSAYMESNFSSWFNASWVLIGSLISNFPSCNICMFKGKGRILWKVYWVAVLWSIWLERNSRCFRTKASSLEDFSCLVKGGVHLGLQCFLNSSLMQLMILWEIGARLLWISPRIIIRYVWQPPLGSFKLNFEGSALGSPGVLGQLRLVDWSKIIKAIMAFCSPADSCFAYQAKASSLLFGLKLAKERSLFHLCHQLGFFGLILPLEDWGYYGGNCWF